MRRILPVLMLLDLTATVGAQVPQGRVSEASTAPNKWSLMFEGPMTVKGTVTEISGHVQISINGIVVTADEVTMDSSTREVTLRGNVRMKLPK